ncbi:hypothetical protein HDF08_003874 [Edaphobacter lichenicola]|uniref:Uncharacterized protein n=1 Tax=Tunturiibacter lichenicola TaxID=2051959 RepID=A0A852VNW6_9BACT|nr:hypothetical protein [Edaphobacter lichenicola]
MDHHQDRGTYGRAAIIGGMDSGMFGPQVTGVVPHVQVLSGFQAAMTDGTAVIAITVDIGVKFVDSRFKSRSTKAF